MIVLGRLRDIDEMLKQGFKVVVVDDVNIDQHKNLIKMAHLMPSPRIINSDDFEYQYLNYLDTGDARHSMLTLTLSILKGNMVAFVISNNYDINYLKVFSKFFIPYDIKSVWFDEFRNRNMVFTSDYDLDIVKYVQGEILKYEDYANETGIVTKGALIRAIKDLNLESKILNVYRKPLDELSAEQLRKIYNSYSYKFSDKVSAEDVRKSPLETGGKSLGMISKERRKKKEESNDFRPRFRGLRNIGNKENH